MPRASMRGSLARVVGNPLVLALGAVGGATYGLSGSWWLLPATLLAAGLVAVTQYRAEAAEPSVLGPIYAARERELYQLMDRITAALAEGSAAIRSSLPDVPGQLQSMRAKVRDLLLRQSRIEAYLDESRPEVAAAELRRLESALAGARSEAAREQFKSALGSKRTELEAREDLRAASERIAAELAATEAALASCLSRILSLEHGHAGDLAQGGDVIGSELEQVLVTIDALEEALAEIHDPLGRRSRV
jgi:chromosome segregation ATPase